MKTCSGFSGALHRHGPQVSKAEPALHQTCGVLGEVDPARLGQRLHALGQADRVAQRSRIEADILTHPARYHLTRGKPETNVEVDALRTPQTLSVGGHRCGQLPGGVARAAGMILLGHRGAEESHDSITSELSTVPPQRRMPSARIWTKRPIIPAHTSGSRFS
jgi:hypothetical protein